MTYSTLFFLLALLYATPAPCQSQCDLHSDYDEISDCRRLYEALESALVTDKNNMFILREYFLTNKFYREILYINYNVEFETESANFTSYSYQTGYSKYSLFTIISPNILGSLISGSSWFGSDWTNLTLCLTNKTLQEIEFDAQDFKMTLNTITTRLNVYATQNVVSYYGERINNEDLGYITMDSHEHSINDLEEVNIAITLATILVMIFICHRLLLLTMWFAQTIKNYETIHPLTVHFYMSLFYSSGFVLLIIKATNLYFSMSKWKNLPHYFITMGTQSTKIAHIIEHVLSSGAIFFAIFGGIIGCVVYVLVDPRNLHGHRRFPSILLLPFFCFNFTFIYYFVYIFSRNVVPTFLMALINPLQVILQSISYIGVIIAGLLSIALPLFPFITLNTKARYSLNHWMCHNSLLVIPVQVTGMLLTVCGYTWTVPLRSDYSGLTQIAAAAFPYALVGVIGYLNKAELFRLLRISEIEQTQEARNATSTSLPTTKDTVAKEQSTEQERSPLLENPDKIEVEIENT